MTTTRPPLPRCPQIWHHEPPHPEQLRSLLLTPCRVLFAQDFLKELDRALSTAPTATPTAATTASPAPPDPQQQQAALAAFSAHVASPTYRHECLAPGVQLLMDRAAWQACPAELLARLFALVHVARHRAVGTVTGHLSIVLMRQAEMQWVAERAPDGAVAVMFSAMEMGLLCPLRDVSCSLGGARFCGLAGVCACGSSASHADGCAVRAWAHVAAPAASRGPQGWGESGVEDPAVLLARDACRVSACARARATAAEEAPAAEARRQLPDVFACQRTAAPDGKLSAQALLSVGMSSTPGPANVCASAMFARR